MQRNFLRVFTGIAAVLMFVAVADVSAQKREVRGRGVNKSQVNAIINRVENRVDNFVRNYDRSLDRSRLNGSSREDWLNKRAKDLEVATDELRREFDRRDAWIENKEETRRSLNIANDIDRNMRSYNFGRTTEANWARVKYELNSLADVYNLPRVGANAYN